MSKFSKSGNRGNGYDIGYGKPPTKTRFKKGQSGNPKGRPKGSKNKKPMSSTLEINNMILEEASRNITVVEGNKRKDIDMKRAISRSIMTNAVKGIPSAQKQSINLITNAEKHERDERMRLFEWAVVYKKKWKNHKSEDGPSPIPDPDHVKIDYSTGEVEIRGPHNEQLKEEIDRALYFRDCYMAQLQEALDGRYSDLTGIPQEELADYIEELRDTIHSVESTYPDWMLNGEYTLDRPPEWHQKVYEEESAKQKRTLENFKRRYIDLGLSSANI